MLFLASNGFRCIAHDRRGHGRSGQPWAGNEMDTYADDLATLIETLDLRGVVLVGFSTGGGEVARYIGRHGTERVAGAALVSAVPPLMLKTDDNPGGVPIEVFDGLRAGSIADRAQLYRDLADGPFFGNNRPGASISQGMRDSFWRAGHAGRAPQHVRVHRRVLGDGLPRRPRAVRRADPRHPRRRRSDRAHRRRRQGVRRARRRSDAQGLPRRPARPDRHAQGPAQRGPAGVLAGRDRSGRSTRPDPHERDRRRPRRRPRRRGEPGARAEAVRVVGAGAHEPAALVGLRRRRRVPRSRPADADARQRDQRWRSRRQRRGRRRGPAAGGGRRARGVPGRRADPRRAHGRRRELARTALQLEGASAFGLPVTEVLLDREGGVLSVTTA